MEFSIIFTALQCLGRKGVRKVVCSGNGRWIVVASSPAKQCYVNSYAYDDRQLQLSVV